MNRTWIVALMLVTVSLAGCATEDDGGIEDGAPAEVEIAWTNEPDDMDTGEQVDASWELTGPEGEIAHTGLHWADHSVSDPESPADYGNATGVSEPANVPGDYTGSVTFEDEGRYYFRAHGIVEGEHIWTDEVSIEVTNSGPAEPPVVVTVDNQTAEADVGEKVWVNWSLTGAPSEVAHTGFHWANGSTSDPASPADYGNSSGVMEPAEVPGSYSANFTEDEPGTYHGRAHAIYQGKHYWSDEITFEVASANGTDGQEVQHHVVEMTGFQFAPSELTVRPGDTINWTNADDVTHTATFEDTENGTDSGDVPGGASFNWTVPEDMPAGTYAYRCTYHSATFDTGMVGEITVEA